VKRKKRKAYKVASEQVSAVPTVQEPPETMTAAEVATLLGVTPGLARAALREAGIRAVARAQWQRMRWKRAEVVAWVEKICATTEV
jgi:hypothetical protein